MMGLMPTIEYISDIRAELYIQLTDQVYAAYCLSLVELLRLSVKQSEDFML